MATGLMTFRSEMDRLFDRFFTPMAGEDGPLTDWAPRLDVSETKDAIVVKAEIPGVDTRDISVSLQDQVLTIKGEKRQEKEDKDERYHRVERSYGMFARSLRIAAGVDAGKVSASFKNGLLTVTMPKNAAAKGATITVKGE